ncbi:MAG TPA: YdcF family protein [Candidatus Nanoarchaeia archaeon]|nr:YdcF family protein [Candidatus Nanoarchaeia archaeon]
MKKGEAVLQKGWTDIGILLGGGISGKRRLPHDPKTRVEKAYHLLKEGYIQFLILSGRCSYGNPELSEAKIYFDYLIEKGIPKERLILEEDSRDTVGNAVFSKKIFLKNKLPQKKIVLITSDYHMKRALMIFTHVFGNGYSFIGISSRPFILHKIALLLKEFEHKEIERLVFSEVRIGDHDKAEELIKRYLPRYR